MVVIDPIISTVDDCCLHESYAHLSSYEQGLMLMMIISSHRGAIEEELLTVTPSSPSTRKERPGILLAEKLGSGREEVVALFPKTLADLPSIIRW